ncbi:alpha/beta-hydrolase [Calocera viscosa TUFC12733]|uniref:Alpha/beta-hydrolase n=1 Tax=Calocera viscosa (strain TUFC12733) TaxID=1330018 RepID=A0A167MFU8_CALVF|nr:alpha/beta-hydrolase [Calocera viscosa TUFC12733]
MSVLVRQAFPALRHSIPRAYAPSTSYITRRHGHKSHIQSGVLDLAFDTYQPPKPDPGGPLLILHGLFGSKQNWRTLMKLLGNSLGRRVYTLDMRNHGTSPHNPQMDYATMAADVVQFMLEHGCKKDVTVMGHSMGGKVAMATALSPLLEQHLPGALARLVVVDMSPAIGKLSDEFQAYIEAMQAVEDAKVPSKKEADPILAKWEKDLPIRQFLLTNLIPHKKGSTFRIPLSILRAAAVHDIGDFPYAPDGTHTWGGRTLFVKGDRSKYINRHNIPLITTYFPRAVLESLDTGHWVHSEKPQEFVELVTKFIRADDKPREAHTAEGVEDHPAEHAAETTI